MALIEADAPSAPRGVLPGLLWLLTATFAARVAGQAIQSVWPQAFLPSFAAFQGSRLPYPVLLATQIAILATMIRFTSRIHADTLVASRRAARLLGLLGGLYLAVAIGRIVIGLVVPQAPPWFSTWIPALFHLVLALWVLLVAGYHHTGAALDKHA